MSVSMTMNGAVLPILAMFIVAGLEQVGVDKCSGKETFLSRVKKY